MKTYCNREERSTIMVLHVLATNALDRLAEMRSVLTPVEIDTVRQAGKGIMRVIADVTSRMADGFAKQLARELEISTLQVYTPGQHRLEDTGDGSVKLSKRFLRELVEEASWRCMGCEGVDACSLAQLKDMTGEKPVDPCNAICPYRVEREELKLEDMEDAL